MLDLLFILLRILYPWFSWHLFKSYFFKIYLIIFDSFSLLKIFSIYFLKYSLHHHYKDWSEVKVTQSCRLFATPWTIQSMEFSWQNTGLGSLSLLQGIFPTQGLNPDLLHSRRILYQLNHKGRPEILELVAYPFFSGSSWPGIKLGSPALRVDSSNWAIREAHYKDYIWVLSKSEIFFAINLIPLIGNSLSSMFAFFFFLTIVQIFLNL